MKILRKFIFLRKYYQRPGGPQSKIERKWKER